MEAVNMEKILPKYLVPGVHGEVGEGMIGPIDGPASIPPDSENLLEKVGFFNSGRRQFVNSCFIAKYLCNIV